MSDSGPRRHAWRIDGINSAEDAEIALRRTLEWVRAELAKVEETRPQDADALRWYLIHMLAPVTAAMHRTRPEPLYFAAPKLPGGGWVPRKPRTRAAEARMPGGAR